MVTLCSNKLYYKQQTKQELKPYSTRTLLRYGTGGRCSTLPGTDTDRCFVSLTQRQTASEELK